MPVFDFLLQEFSSHIVRRYFIIDFSYIPKGIVILDDGETDYQPECIYIGSWEHVSRDIESGKAPKYSTFFIADMKEPLPAIKDAFRACNLVFTDLPVAKLNNVLNRALMKIYQLEDRETHLSFNSFLYEIILGKKNRYEEIEDMIDSLNYPVKDFFSFILIDFDDKKTVIGKGSVLFDELAEIFPECNMSIFLQRIVIMYSAPERYVRLPDSIQQPLLAFLEKHGAVASIGSPFRDYSIIPIEYNIMSSILRIGRSINSDNKRRIFTEEQYGIYYVMELCARKFESLYGTNDIVYLSHPGIVALLRYDRAHNTNLCEVLQCYLQNDRNISKTASEMYMHRNTVLNKIAKITEIIHDDLDDYAVRFRLTFSFMLLDFYEHYKKQYLRI